MNDLPRLHIIALPQLAAHLVNFHDQALIVRPEAEHDLSALTPRQRWKLASQIRRLARRGIILAPFGGYIGSIKDAQVE